ncbi:MAG: hypothetical protein LUH51_00570 [Firmicutes bacterium]|nr:hypothetical protein [Bacillota bacterium]
MKFLRKNPMLMAAIILLLAGILWSVASPTSYVILSVSETSFQASIPDADFSFSCEREEITGVQCIELSDFGTAVETQSKNRLTWGIYCSDTLGTYTLMVSSTFSTVIILQTAAGETLVFNYHSAADTQSIYTALLEELEG